MRLADAREDFLGPYSSAMLDRAAPAPGEHALDVGCGTGITTLELARRVGPGGSAVGLDISKPMIDEARRRAAEVGVDNATFEHGDAQLHAFEPGTYDLACSRLGTMFFADTVAAFANIRAALRDGGRFVLVCWQAMEANPWIGVPFAAAAQHVELVSPANPDQPGPFRQGDADGLRAELRRAGYSEVAIEPFEHPFEIPTTDRDEAVARLGQVGPVRAVYEGDDPGRAAALAAVAEAVEPYRTATRYRFPAAAWVVRATR